MRTAFHVYHNAPILKDQTSRKEKFSIIKPVTTFLSGPYELDLGFIWALLCTMLATSICYSTQISADAHLNFIAGMMTSLKLLASTNQKQ
ncbi:hypothetical protein ACHAW6_010856 [Cyclotella cf. meneghiniana]